MKIARWVAVGVLGCLLGCGQKGPLVLPDAQHPHRKIALPKPPTAPQSSPIPASPGTAPASSLPVPSSATPTPAPDAAPGASAGASTTPAAPPP